VGLGFEISNRRPKPFRDRPSVTGLVPRARDKFKSVLHLFEAVHVGLAYGEGFGEVFEPDDPAAGQGPADTGDTGDIDHGSPMDLPEEIWIKLSDQGLDRFPDEMFVRCGANDRIFVARFEIGDLVYGDKLNTFALLDPNPAKMAALLLLCHARQDPLDALQGTEREALKW